jgi:hypothetical protein
MPGKSGCFQTLGHYGSEVRTKDRVLSDDPDALAFKKSARPGTGFIKQVIYQNQISRGNGHIQGSRGRPGKNARNPYFF